MREQYIDEEVITIGQIIRVIKSYSLYFLRKWWLLILVAAALGAYRVYTVYTTAPEYSAGLTFTLYEEGGGGGGGGGALSGLIGQIGLGSIDNVDFDRIVEFMETRQIIGAAMFQKVRINGVEDYYANHYLRELKLYEKWEEKEAVKFIDFWFTRSDVENFTPVENIVLNVIWNQVKNRHLKTEIRGSGIIEMKMTSESQPFSIEFAKTLFIELAFFYKEKLNEKNRTNYNQMEYRKDSIAAELKVAEARYARFQDTNKNLRSARALIEDIRLRRSVEVLNAIYLELVKQVEVLNFTLKRETPYLISIDEPVYPLPGKKLDMIWEGIKYAIGGILLTILILAMIKFARDAVESDRKREEELEKLQLKREYEKQPEPAMA